MTGIAINHLLLWESGLVSLKPLEVGELHFRAQAAEGGRPVTFFRIPNQIPPSLTSFFAFNYQDALPFSGSLTCHMKQSLFIKRGPRLLMAAPLAPTEKKPQRPLFLFLTHSQGTCFDPWTSSVRGGLLNLTDDDSRPRRLPLRHWSSFYVGADHQSAPFDQPNSKKTWFLLQQESCYCCSYSKNGIKHFPPKG